MKLRNAPRENPVVVVVEAGAVVVAAAADHAAGKRQRVAMLPKEPARMRGQAPRHSPHFFELRDDVDRRRFAGF
jgi:hypothetical protein